MKKQDLIFILVLVLVFLPFFLSSDIYSWYKSFNGEHRYIMAFLKFGILSTMGEMLGLRIRKGVYNEAGFGVLPRALVWGFLGMWITLMMSVNKTGVPTNADYIFGTGGRIAAAMNIPAFSGWKLLGAFCISLVMNTTFAPVFMTLHKVTDAHIMNNGGTMKGFFSPIKFREIFTKLNWDVQWSFVFKKTIPFFWIPAHTLTFILPDSFQVLFAAILGVALGVILSVAAGKK